MIKLKAASSQDVALPNGDIKVSDSSRTKKGRANKKGDALQQQQDVIYSVHALRTDLDTCSTRRDLQQGRKIHAKAVESQNAENRHVLRALINMYAKCGRMCNAIDMFNTVKKPDILSWNALLLGYADNGDGIVSLELFSRMKVFGCPPNPVTFVAVLKACITLAVNGDDDVKQDCLKQGREIHSQVGCHLNHHVQNKLIYMYSKCSSMADALVVFDTVPNPDVVSWNVMILGYADNGNGLAALEMFSRMKARGCLPDPVTYVAAIKACTSLAVTGKEECLKRGREVHSEVGFHLDVYVQSSLIDMYAKCGTMFDARSVFDSVQKPDVVSWNALLLGYAENGEGLVALEMFSRMKARGCTPSSVTYIAALKACTSLAVHGDGKQGLEWGRDIHLQIGCHLNHYVKNTLIDMYAKCRSMGDARLVFDSFQKPDVVSWTAMLLGYAENGDGVAALEMFSRMKACGCSPDSVTHLAALKACGSIGALDLGRKFHLEISEPDSYLVTCLVDFYARCGSMLEARRVFDLHSEIRDASTWNALLAGYGSFGDSDSVFKLFEGMQDEGFQPNAVTFVSILLCCSRACLVDKAREYFEAMSAKYRVTATVIHYTCMVEVLGRENQLNEVVLVVRTMPCNPDAVTWTTLLGACRKWKNVRIGELAFQSLVDIDKNDASAYVLMAHIYGSVGMWEEQEKVLECWSLL